MQPVPGVEEKCQTFPDIGYRFIPGVNLCHCFLTQPSELLVGQSTVLQSLRPDGGGRWRERCQVWAAGPPRVEPCQSAHAAPRETFILTTSQPIPLLQAPSSPLRPPRAHQRPIFHAGRAASEAGSQGQVGSIGCWMRRLRRDSEPRVSGPALGPGQ